MRSVHSFFQPFINLGCTSILTGSVFFPNSLLAGNEVGLYSIIVSFLNDSRLILHDGTSLQI